MTPLELVHKAISAGVGNIMFQDKAARIVRDDPNMAGLTPNGLRQLLHEFVKAGGRVDAREQHLEQYREEHPYWYRAIIPVADFPQGLFLEVILVDDDENEPFVEVVSANPRLS